MACRLHNCSVILIELLVGMNYCDNGVLYWGNIAATLGKVSMNLSYCKKNGIKY